MKQHPVVVELTTKQIDYVRKYFMIFARSIRGVGLPQHVLIWFQKNSESIHNTYAPIQQKQAELFIPCVQINTEYEKVAVKKEGKIEYQENGMMKLDTDEHQKEYQEKMEKTNYIALSMQLEETIHEIKLYQIEESDMKKFQLLPFVNADGSDMTTDFEFCYNLLTK